MERFAQLGKSCSPFARGDWNAALLSAIPPTLAPYVALLADDTDFTVCNNIIRCVYRAELILGR